MVPACVPVPPPPWRSRPCRAALRRCQPPPPPPNSFEFDLIWAESTESVADSPNRTALIDQSFEGQVTPGNGSMVYIWGCAKLLRLKTALPPHCRARCKSTRKLCSINVFAYWPCRISSAALPRLFRAHTGRLMPCKPGNSEY